MEMVGLGRQQKCSGAQNPLQQLVKERLRGLVESWMGEGSLDPPEMSSGSQPEEAACETGWTGALLSHKAASLTALLVAAALTVLGFWDLRLLLEMVGALTSSSYLYHAPSLLVIAGSLSVAHCDTAEAL